MRQALFGEKLMHTLGGHELNRNGSTSAILVGGNLSVLYSILGSKSDIDTKGKILFLEDLDEYLYHIDRMIVGMKRAGKFDNLAGLIIGGMSKMKDNDIPFGKTPREIIAEHTAEYKYPICFGFQAGHIEHNRTLVLGAKHRFIVDEVVSLKQL